MKYDVWLYFPPVVIIVFSMPAYCLRPIHVLEFRMVLRAHGLSAQSRKIFEPHSHILKPHSQNFKLTW